MKKKVIALIAALLCVVTVLVACSSTAKFDDALALDSYVDKNPIYTKAETLSFTDAPTGALGQLMLFVDTNDTGNAVHSVFNVDTNATVYTATESKTVTGDTTVTVRYEITLDDVWDKNMIFCVKTTTTTQTSQETTVVDSYTYYDAKGVQFASFADLKETPNYDEQLDLIRIENKVYRVSEDSSVSAVCDIAYYADFPAVQAKVGDYYYEYANAGTKDKITVYNVSLVLVQQYEIPSYASGDIWILNNGNLLIQYRYAVDPLADEDDYDILYGSKLMLESYVLNVKNGKLKEVDLKDWLVTNVMARDVVWDTDTKVGWNGLGFNEDVENVAVAFPIEDKLVDQATSSVKYVILSKKGKPKDTIDGYIAAMDASSLVMLANNRFAVKNHAGRWYLLNEEGNNIGEIPDPTADAAKMVRNEKYMVIGKRIYDYNLTMVFDATELEYKGMLAHGILYTNKDGETLLFADGQMKTVIDKEAKATQSLVYFAPDYESGRNYVLSGRVFLVKKIADGATTYDIYNDAGTVLMNTDAVVEVGYAIATGTETENVTVLSGYKMVEGEMKYVYIRLSAA